MLEKTLQGHFQLVKPEIIEIDELPFAAPNKIEQKLKS
jgi:hypothetical protein